MDSVAMDAFCAERLSVPARLRPRHGVLRAAALAVAWDAQRAAALIVAEARAEADALLEQAHARAADVARLEQQRIAGEATVLLDALRQAQHGVLDGVTPLAIDLAARAFAQLVAETPPQERVAAAVRRIAMEAPSQLVSAVAWVHPEDLALAEAAPWEVRADPRLRRGSCRLEAGSGEWHADFELGAAALQEALRGLEAVDKN